VRLPSSCSVAAQLRTRDSGVPPRVGLPLPWRDHRGVKNTTCLSASGGFGTWWEWCSLSLLAGFEAMMASDSPLRAKARLPIRALQAMLSLLGNPGRRKAVANKRAHDQPNFVDGRKWSPPGEEMRPLSASFDLEACMRKNLFVGPWKQLRRGSQRGACRMSPGKPPKARGNPAPGHKKGSPFAVGALFAKAADLGTFSGHPENSELLRKLNKRLKLFRGEDGWFARGRKGQLWEYGTGKLGFTVGTPRMVANALEAGFVATQRGDQEANFSCPWTEETIERLIKLLRLRTRGVGNPSPKPMPHHRNGKISGESERIGVLPRTGTGKVAAA
jgi:hypothetical protein